MASTKALAAGGVVLVAVGFGAGALVFSGGAPEVRTQTVTVYASAPAEPAAAAAVAAPPAAPKPAPAPPPATAAPSVALSDGDREALRAILGKIPEVEVPAGSGTISGRVRTEDGRPLEGVEIVLTPDAPTSIQPRYRPFAPLVDRDPTDSAAQSFVHARWLRQARRRGVTDAAGEFRIDGVAEASHQATAVKSGWWVQPTNWRTVNSCRPGAVLEFKAVPQREIRVEVLLPDGTPSDSAQLNFQGPTSVSWNMSQRNYSLTLKPGDYEVTATAGDQGELKSETISYTVPVEGEPPLLRVQLVGKPGIKGRLRFPAGEESGRVRVCACRIAPGTTADPKALGSSGTFTDLYGPQDEYRFKFVDLPPGRWALGATRDQGGPVPATVEVEVGSGMTACEVPVPALERADYVAVLVIGPDGKPLTDVQVTTGWRSAQGSSSSGGGNDAIRRPDGTMWVFHQPSGQRNDEDGTYWVEVHHPKHGSLRGEYKREEASEVTLRYAEAGRVDARLTGATGSPFESRLQFALRSAAEDASGMHSGYEHDGKPGADGLQSFTGVQPGEHVLVLQILYEGRPADILRTPITVRPGRNEVPVALPALHSVTVTGASGYVSLTKKGDRARTFFLNQRADKDGRAVFDGLPEGEYTVNGGGKSQSFRVPGTPEVKF